jgi:hypothetical protein
LLKSAARIHNNSVPLNGNRLDSEAFGRAL